MTFVCPNCGEVIRNVPDDTRRFRCVKCGAITEIG